MISVEGIRSAISSDGYVVTEAGSLEAFHDLCRQVGEVTQTLDVRITPGGTFYAECPHSVPLHTDNPTVPIVAWHCLQQDASDGTLELMSAVDILDWLSPECVALLCEVQFPLIRGNGMLPCLRLDPFRIYWLPRYVEQVKAAATREQREALETFITFSAAVRRTGVRLAPGQSLFLNNHAMLHGRDAIPPDSTRHLVRNFIVT